VRSTTYIEDLQGNYQMDKSCKRKAAHTGQPFGGQILA